MNGKVPMRSWQLEQRGRHPALPSPHCPHPFYPLPTPGTTGLCACLWRRWNEASKAAAKSKGLTAKPAKKAAFKARTAKSKVKTAKAPKKPTSAAKKVSSKKPAKAAKGKAGGKK